MPSIENGSNRHPWYSHRLSWVAARPFHTQSWDTVDGSIMVRVSRQTRLMFEKSCHSGRCRRKVTSHSTPSCEGPGSWNPGLRISSNLHPIAFAGLLPFGWRPGGGARQFLQLNCAKDNEHPLSLWSWTDCSTTAAGFPAGGRWYGKISRFLPEPWL